MASGPVLRLLYSLIFAGELFQHGQPIQRFLVQAPHGYLMAHSLDMWSLWERENQNLTKNLIRDTMLPFDRLVQ